STSHLSEIVGSEREEVTFSRELVSTNGSAGYFDHRSHSIVDLAFTSCLLCNRAHHFFEWKEFRKITDQRHFNLWNRIESLLLHTQAGKEDGANLHFCNLGKHNT